ncbi:glycosyltransferase [bacterium]|nr:glycosyltransferase [bacterium]
MTKISVIIPYQNVENYIEDCLNSVIGQTLADIEIICINDSSSDKSQEIVQRFASQDSRIKMLNTEKPSGQGYARNLALDVAQGEYIGFVDSDDWINTDMFEKMYQKAKYHDSDITMCGANVFDDTLNETVPDEYYSLIPLKKYGENVFSAVDTKDEILNINVVLWNKIYKKSFLDTTQERFPNGYIYEDLPFFFGTYLKAQRINIVWENLYNYRINRRFSNLSTMQNTDKKVYDRIPMVSLTYEKLKQAPFYKEKEIDILSWIIDDIFHRYTVLEEKYYKEYFYDMKKLFQSFALQGDDIYKLATCYCFEEYCSIIKDNYFDFWKFLIEKYKLANKKVKLAQHERNESIKSINKFWKEYKEKQDKEREEIIVSWMKKYDSDMKEQYGKYVALEYDLKKWQAKSLRECEEKITANYKWLLEDREMRFKQALIKQKEYYENNFLLVKINIKLKKKFNQLVNKIKKFLKMN